MATTAMFAPYEPAHAMARRVVALPTGNIYQFNAQGAAAVDTADVAWFQMQGFAPTPTAGGGQVLIYAPYIPDQEFARRITVPSGNSYFFSAAGAAAVASADVAWFQSQGYALAPAPGAGQTAMYVSFEVGQAMAGPIVSPITGKMYVVNGQGYVLVDTADVGWFQGQGFSPSVGGGGGGGVVFPPVVGVTQATIAADFAGGQYWASAATQANFAAWMTAIGGTYSRSSSATYLQGGVVQTAAANGARFPTDLGGTPLGIRLTGAATNLLLQSNAFTTSPWVNNATLGITSSGTGPDGSTAAWSLVPPSATTFTFIYQPTASSLGAGQVTASAFFKPGAFNFGWVCAVDPSNRFTGVFNLTTGALTATGTSGTPTGTSSGSILLANGWVLVWVTMNCGAGGGFIEMGPVHTGTPTFTNETPLVIGNGVSGVLAFGAQVTNTAFPCDYIPTTTATVTQAADFFNIPNVQTTFSVLIGTTGFYRDASGGTPRIVASSGSDATICAPSDTSFATAPGGGSFISISSTSVITNPHKVMAAGNTTNTWITADGQVPNTLAQKLVNAGNANLYLANDGGSPPGIYGNVSQFALWNALVASTSEMQRLTT